MQSDIIQQFGNFTDYEMKLFSVAVQERKIFKNEFLLQEGSICQSLYFISSGSFIQYKIKDEIDQQIIDLHLANEWMLNPQSFVRQQPSETFIQAFADATIYELTVHAMHDLIKQSPVFFQLAKLLEPAHSRIQLFDNQLSPGEKYRFVLDNRPGLLLAFPLKMIASYLKITPETLSRVREKFAK
ncbi:Crp/Fnr family transcriptional regulator [Flavihumibacter sp. UBA7668]|uniref:Crp/Fnr family transcriptional regulator n=1 Tax=Flavihumibacter sp. UBA7668 TaxID=1946542 RepID=UPI0025C30791|nr:Crp/Fnr family transcriptional regulator [Flavihumibacter sp. UBA7668]